MARREAGTESHGNANARPRFGALAIVVLGSVGLLSADARAQEEPQSGEQFLNLPLETLLTMKVTTA
jgi:hypothetical protein